MAQISVTHRDLQLPVVLTLTTTLAVAATSATLTSNFLYVTTSTAIATFTSGETRTVTLTGGATTCTWSGGLLLAAGASISVTGAHDGAQTSTTALVANTAREFVQIQNQGTNALFVFFGSGASTSIYNFVLKAATGAADGSGGSFSSQNVVYRGIITVAGTSPSYSIIEM